MPDLSRARPHRSRGRTTLLCGALLTIAALCVLPVQRPADAAATTEVALGLAGDLAEAATTRLSRRLERLRDPESVEVSGVDLKLRFGAVEADRTLDPWLADEPAPTFALPFDLGTFEGRPTPARQLEVRRSARSTGAVDLWGTGRIEFGRLKSGMLDPLASTADLAAGIDGAISAGSAFGVAMGLNRLSADGVGTLSAPSLSAYGTLRPTPGSFVDTLAGVALLEREGRNAAAPAFGGSPMAFAAATLGYDYRHGALGLSPYGRIEGSGVRTARTKIAGPSETRLLAGRASAVAGVKADYRLRTGGMSFKPGLRLEMLREIARTGGQNGSLVHSTQRYLVSPGVRADLGAGWSARLEHRSVFGAVDTRALEFRVDARF